MKIVPRMKYINSVNNSWIKWKRHNEYTVLVIKVLWRAIMEPESQKHKGVRDLIRSFPKPRIASLSNGDARKRGFLQKVWESVKPTGALDI